MQHEFKFAFSPQSWTQVWQTTADNNIGAYLQWVEGKTDMSQPYRKKTDAYLKSKENQSTRFGHNYDAFRKQRTPSTAPKPFAQWQQRREERRGRPQNGHYRGNRSRGNKKMKKS